MPKSLYNDKKNKRDFLRSAFFSCLEEERRLLVGDFVLVNTYNKQNKIWIVSIYPKEKFLRQYNPFGVLQIRMEKAEITNVGVVTLPNKNDIGTVS